MSKVKHIKGRPTRLPLMKLNTGWFRIGRKTLLLELFQNQRDLFLFLLKMKTWSISVAVLDTHWLLMLSTSFHNRVKLQLLSHLSNSLLHFWIRISCSVVSARCAQITILSVVIAVNWVVSSHPCRWVTLPSLTLQGEPQWDKTWVILAKSSVV